MATITLWNNAELHVCWKESGTDQGHAMRFMNMADTDCDPLYLNASEAQELAHSILNFFKSPEEKPSEGT